VRKQYLLLLIPVLVAILFFVPKMVAGPERRTNTYFAIQRQWTAHWPFASGKYAPRVLLPAVLPVVPVWYQVEPHIKMLLDPEDMVAREILESGGWEPGSWKMMREHLGTGGTFVDVGAQIGYYSLKAAPVVGVGGSVIAIEPNPETVRKLQANIDASGAKAVTVAPVACADTEAMLDLFAAPESNTGETSLSKANASQAGPVANTFKVRARPLDDIIRELAVARVDVIKIDVEGAEYLVLKGALETMDRHHPMLLLELIDRQLQSMGSSVAQVVQLLRAHGYRPGRTDGDNVEFLWAAGVASRSSAAGPLGR
jgi:FkbM family methyltransferase